MGWNWSACSQREADENQIPPPWLYLRADLLTCGLAMPSDLRPPGAFVWLWDPRPLAETLSLILWASLAVYAKWEPFPMVSHTVKEMKHVMAPNQYWGMLSQVFECMIFLFQKHYCLQPLCQTLFESIRLWYVPIIFFSFCNSSGWGGCYSLHWGHP